MKKKNKSISSPEELNSHLQHSSPTTWIVLGLVIATLIGFFAWSFIYKLKIKISGNAVINSGNVTLNVLEKDLDKLEVGQLVYISNKEGKIASINDDGQPVVSNFDLEDGDNYKYYVVIKEMRPIDFLIGK